MTEETISPWKGLAEAAQNSAQVALHKQQRVKFVGRKLTAMQTVMTSIRGELAAAAERHMKTQHQAATVLKHQSDLQLLLKQITVLWSEAGRSQMVKGQKLAHLKQLTTDLARQQAEAQQQLANTLQADHQMVVKKAALIASRLQDLEKQLQTLDTVADLKQFDQQLSVVLMAVRAYQKTVLAREQSLALKLQALQKQADKIEHVIGHYDHQLMVVAGKIKAFDHAITVADQKLNRITPKRLDLSIDEILCLFRQEGQKVPPAMLNVTADSSQQLLNTVQKKIVAPAVKPKVVISQHPVVNQAPVKTEVKSKVTAEPETEVKSKVTAEPETEVKSEAQPEKPVIKRHLWPFWSHRKN